MKSYLRSLLIIVKIIGPLVSAYTFYIMFTLRPSGTSNFDWKIAIGVISMTVLFIIGGILSKFIKKFTQNERSLLANRISADPTSHSFILYLHPFRCLPEIFITAQRNLIVGPFLPNWFIPGDHTSLKELVYLALEKDAPLVELIPTTDRQEYPAFQKSVTAEVLTDDKCWYERFSKLVDLAQMVILYPGSDSKGLVREISHVFNTPRLLEKTIILIPPLHLVGDAIHRNQLHNHLQMGLAAIASEFDVNIPYSSEKGGLCVVKATGIIGTVSPFPSGDTLFTLRYPEYGVSPYPLRRAITRLISNT